MVALTHTEITMPADDELPAPALLLNTAQQARRRFITQAGTVTFSGVAVAMPGG